MILRKDRPRDQRYDLGLGGLRLVGQIIFWLYTDKKQRLLLATNRMDRIGDGMEEAGDSGRVIGA